MSPACAAGSPPRSERADSYRVRYTGKPAHLPVDFAVRTTGVELRFSDPLDPQAVGDLANFTAERWNYFWSGNYGSAEYSVTHPKEPKHDTLTIQSAHLSADGRTLTLDIADMRKSQQLQINLKLRTADGRPIGACDLSHRAIPTMQKKKKKNCYPELDT